MLLVFVFSIVSFVTPNTITGNQVAGSCKPPYNVIFKIADEFPSWLIILDPRLKVEDYNSFCKENRALRAKARKLAEAEAKAYCGGNPCSPHVIYHSDETSYIPPSGRGSDQHRCQYEFRIFCFGPEDSPSEQPSFIQRTRDNIANFIMGPQQSTPREQEPTLTSERVISRTKPSTTQVKTKPELMSMAQDSTTTNVEMQILFNELQTFCNAQAGNCKTLDVSGKTLYVEPTTASRTVKPISRRTR